MEQRLPDRFLDAEQCSKRLGLKEHMFLELVADGLHPLRGHGRHGAAEFPIARSQRRWLTRLERQVVKRRKSFAAWISSFTFCCCCCFPPPAQVPNDLPPIAKEPEPQKRIDLISEIATAYRRSDANGNAKFRGKQVELPCVVYESKRDPLEGPHIIGNAPGDSKFVIIALFPQNAVVIAEKGQQIRVRGKLTNGFADKKGAVTITLDSAMLVE